MHETQPASEHLQAMTTAPAADDRQDTAAAAAGPIRSPAGSAAVAAVVWWWQQWLKLLAGPAAVAVAVRLAAGAGQAPVMDSSSVSRQDTYLKRCGWPQVSTTSGTNMKLPQQTCLTIALVRGRVT